MSTPVFDIEPFQSETGRVRSRAPAAHSHRQKSAPHPPYAPRWPHWPAWRNRRVIVSPYSLVGPDYVPGYPPTYAPFASEPVSGSTEYIRWIQDSLNRILGISMPVDGIMTPAVRTSIRAFQRKQRLPASGYIGPDTDAALRRAGSGEQTELSELESQLSGAAQVADAALDRSRAGPIRQTLGFLGKVPVPGLYRFHAASGRFYTGMATDLRRRILQHLWCLSHFGVSERNYRLAIHRMPGQSEAQIRAIERTINAHYRSNNPGKVLNAQTELEVMELNEI